MKNFYITAHASRVSGTQTYVVEASSIEEARRLWVTGDESVRMIDEDVEITELGDDIEIEEEELEDTR